MPAAVPLVTSGMRQLERLAGRVQVVGTVIVVACTLVTTWFLVQPPSAAVVFVADAPPKIAYLPRGPWAVRPTTACPTPRESAAFYNQHSWIDPWGTRVFLTCGEQAVMRTAGPDGVAGTADDVCYETKSGCTLVPSSAQTDGL